MCESSRAWPGDGTATGCRTLLDEGVALDLVHADVVLLLIDLALVEILLHPVLLVIEVEFVAAAGGAGAHRAAHQGLAAGHQKHRRDQRCRCNLGRDRKSTRLNSSH